MAWPYVFEENFESGDKGNFDTETDSASQLDFPHYAELARHPDRDHIPYAGAYVARWILSGGTADAILIEADINIAANTQNYFRMGLYFSEDFTATADDTVALLELKASSTVEAAFGFRIVAATGVINLGIGETVPASFSAVEIKRGTWYNVELRVDIDDAAEDDGSIGLFITEYGTKLRQNTAEEVTVSSLDQGAVTDGVLGAQDHLATTTGTILIDHFVQDDAQLYPLDRFPQTVEITQTRQVFAGPGDIISAALLDDTTGDESLTLYDSDKGLANGQNFVLELVAGVQVSNDDILHFDRGCYAVLGGNSPRGQVVLPGGASRRSGAIGPIQTPQQIKRLGLSRGA
ncbi:hypothetical protein KAR91_40995 [Candidatus Pacearchaeota archaeon]|nr:hypothetical protein [Candidatus Pacearchaeota archaeon]